MRHSYQATLGACFAGYIVQSVINLFAPLLFLTFQREFSLSLDQIALLITVNFLVQLCVDGLSARFVDKIGWRVCMVAAHLFAALGLVLLAVLPGRIPPLAGLTTAVVVYALGGGLLEVLVSPIAEACPTRRKSAVMGLLHSFYCWGSVATIALSTLFLSVSAPRTGVSWPCSGLCSPWSTPWCLPRSPWPLSRRRASPASPWGSCSARPGFGCFCC